jgi:hypothetical protein
MNRRQRKRWERYVREIEAAEAKAMSPEAVALRTRQAQRKAEREAERMALWAAADRREEERQDERNFLMDALESLAGAIESTVRPLMVADEFNDVLVVREYAVALIEDNESEPDAVSLAVSAVYCDGAEAAIPFVERAATQRAARLGLSAAP